MSARRKRRNYNEPGHAHELTFSCYRRFQFLTAERTCLWLSDAIDKARKSLDFDLWAYVFMPEHVHLIVHPRRPVYEIADIRKAIKEPVGRKAIAYLRENASDWLPKITRRRGDREESCFWMSGGGYDRNVIQPATLLRAIEYIHLNPVRRGLVARTSDWKWSSAAWYEGTGIIGLRPDPILPKWVEG